MKGLKEILFSCVLTLTTILAFSKFHRELKKEERPEVHEEPTASAGEILMDDGDTLNWGVRDVHAPAAWRRHRGSRDVVVAVIDTGCDIHHPALTANIWRNPGEGGLDRNGSPKSSNGIDDDDNGFVDDFHGWSFVSNSNDVSDEHGHGTHIAGIIGAEKIYENGTAGVTPHVSLMILKYYDTESSGKENLTNTIAAIHYAVRMGADIINYSGGGITKSADEEEALRWAAEQGVLVVAAAGNEGLNSDFFHFYPADYSLPNILSVAAIDSQEQLMRMSNYGITTVHLAAPGKNIYSTLPNGQYGYMSGTSQATAFATGVAALLIANDVRMQDPQVLIEHLTSHVSPREALRGKIRSGGLLDAELALSHSDLQLTAIARTRTPSQVTTRTTR